MPSVPKEKAMDLKNCTIKLRDGAGTPNEIELKIDEGNLRWTHARTIEPKLDRGELDYMAEGDQVPMKVTLECRFASITSSSGDFVTPFEFLTFTGGAEDYVSTADECAAKAIDIIVEIEQPCGTTVEDEIITFSEFTYETIDGDFKAGTLSVSGVCNAVMPTSERTSL